MEIRVKTTLTHLCLSKHYAKTQISKPTDGLHRTETSTCKSTVGFEQKDRTSLSRIELGSDHMQSEGFHDWATQQLSDVGRIHTLSNLWKVGSKIGSGLLVRRNIDASDFTKYDVQSPNKITLLMHKGCGSMTQPTRIKTGIKINNEWLGVWSPFKCVLWAPQTSTNASVGLLPGRVITV